MHVESNYKARKIDKKQRRCLAIIEKDCGVVGSTTATSFLAVLNAGLSNGLSEERLLFATAETGGAVVQVFMLPGKSYCFVNAASEADAERIYFGMHAKARIGQKDAIVYLNYITQPPKELTENIWKKTLPPGLVVVHDFVTPHEEDILLEAVNQVECSNVAGELKHRKVKHFGYEFLYGTNNIDVTHPLQQGIPEPCSMLWPRLEAYVREHELPALAWREPNQLTVNIYTPGHGIPAHVDTHSAFLDPILSLSFEDDIVMDFRRGNERVPVVLPRRSLLIMSGESRYDWTHGITPKHFDVVPTLGGTLTAKTRHQRTSLTFRCLRSTPCNCAFPTLCDTRQTTKSPTELCRKLAESAAAIEQQNVHMIYDKIANHFSETRHTPWPQVVDFLKSFEPHSIVLDVGCGNGKYLNCNTELLTIGCDRSAGLLGVCTERGDNVFRCDCLQLPVRDGSIDGCISIAVIHHLATVERRQAAVREMARVLRPGGRALIYVWAKNQKCDSNKSSYLLQNKSVNRQRTTEQVQRQLTAQQNLQEQQKPKIALPIHTNRTEFQSQDVLVPWKMKDESKTTFLRYYHVFEEHELKQLIAGIWPELRVEQSFYDQGNHCVIFRRKCQ